MRKFDPASALIALQLQQTVHEFAHEVDTNNGLNVADFYAEDGVFAVGDFSHVGHTAIRKFYADRLRRIPSQHKDGVRVSAHTFLNLRVHVDSAERASVFFTNVNYAGEGHPPVRATITPAMVTTCRMDFRLDADGHWRITSFTGKPLFIGDDPFTRQALMKS